MEALRFEKKKKPKLGNLSGIETDEHRKPRPICRSGPFHPPVMMLKQGHPITNDYWLVDQEIWQHKWEQTGPEITISASVKKKRGSHVRLMCHIA